MSNNITQMSDLMAVTGGGSKVPGKFVYFSLSNILVDALTMLNPKKAVLCSDMDLLENPEVTKALKWTKKVVTEQLPVTYESFSWNPMYNGIDDYLLYCKNCMAV